ncbi:Oidioi.mRNA.OKI2018_I69.PAR.g12258.t1.cds [Oikopleura dioica]|uniref:Oidioi.mRNA.OKI2018_I69.PAR.g12258.t1.cds n=1 Tax=Oikopleura dioica TaxID=34765 RepID=A0ABN7S5L1_OIKDI|nr:Oidioi.mRNA.OKI2018_I69.PAR.g12258.t1.cds [Oikopleura dioica]
MSDKDGTREAERMLVDQPMDDPADLLDEADFIAGYNEHNSGIEPIETAPEPEESASAQGTPVPMEVTPIEDSITIHAVEDEENDLLGSPGPLVMDLPTSADNSRAEDMSQDEDDLLAEQPTSTERETAGKKKVSKPPTANPLPKSPPVVISSDEMDHDRPGPSGLQQQQQQKPQRAPEKVAEKPKKKYHPRRMQLCPPSMRKKQPSGRVGKPKKSIRRGGERPQKAKEGESAEPANSDQNASASGSSGNNNSESAAGGQGGEGWVIPRRDTGPRWPTTSTATPTTTSTSSPTADRAGAETRRSPGRGRPRSIIVQPQVNNNRQAEERYDPDLAWHQRRYRRHYWDHRHGDIQRANTMKRLSRELVSFADYAGRRGYARYFPNRTMLKIGESHYFGLTPIGPPPKLREGIKKMFMALVNLKEEDMGLPWRAPRFDIFLDELNEVQRAYSERLTALTNASQAGSATTQTPARSRQPGAEQPQPSTNRRRSSSETDSLPSYSTAIRQAPARRSVQPRPASPFRIRVEQEEAPMAVSPVASPARDPEVVITGVNGARANAPVAGTRPDPAETSANATNSWGPKKAPKPEELVPPEDLMAAMPPGDQDPVLTEEEKKRDGWFWLISDAHFNVASLGMRRLSPNYINDCGVLAPKVTPLLRRRTKFEQDLLALGVTKTVHPDKHRARLDEFMVKTGDENRVLMLATQTVLCSDDQWFDVMSMLREFAFKASPDRFPLFELMTVVVNEAFNQGGPAVRRFAHRAAERILKWGLDEARHIKGIPVTLQEAPSLGTSFEGDYYVNATH